MAAAPHPDGRPGRPRPRRRAGCTGLELSARCGLKRGMMAGVTKKIGISVPEDLYDWAARAVKEGRAESVSALIVEGLEILEARAELEAVVTDLRAEAGELDERARKGLGEALAAADEAYRRHGAERTGNAGHAA